MSEIQGYDELLKQFAKIENLNWVQAEQKGMEVVAEEARAIVPVDTGALQSTIRVETVGEEVQLVAGGDGFDYSLYVEFGTVKMAAQPSMRPAIDNKEREMLKVIAADLEAKMRKIAND